MIYTDLLIKEDFDELIMKEALSYFFQVNLDDIEIIVGIEGLQKANNNLITCKKEFFNEGFKVLCSFYIDEKLIKIIPQRISFGKFITNYIKIDCLLPSDSPNPYEMILFQKGCNEQIVFLKVDKYDNDEVYILDE